MILAIDIDEPGKGNDNWLVDFHKCQIWNGNVEMLSTSEIIREAESLPVEERALVVDHLLRSLNQPDAAMDNKWAEVACRRGEELRSGQIKAVSSETVLARLRARFPS